MIKEFSMILTTFLDYTFEIFHSNVFQETFLRASVSEKLFKTIPKVLKIIFFTRQFLIIIPINITKLFWSAR